ncbi:MAG TPA: ring-cleaving dioxygenase [Terriglobia bacterium]|nr:ring-cleaving dioxygenase [Terriglobia bacterium]
MSKQILGIHHVTAIAGDPQQNLDFYTGVLGLRLVKLTVNYDDPQTYHLYYGDAHGTPGTILTFFPWPRAKKGRQGHGQVTVTAFSVPEPALEFWAKRLSERGVEFEGPFRRFQERVMTFSDPDGLRLELVAGPPLSSEKREPTGPIPPEYAIHGFHSATVAQEGYERTAFLLTETLGFRLVQQESNRFRYAVGRGEPSSIVDVVCVPDSAAGGLGSGTVHHIAWRTPDDPQQNEWHTEIARQGYNISPVMDRKYFHSIYFREPGGVLFEIATDHPGFAVDEPAASLGAKLVLPDWLETRRSQIEARLPPLRIPKMDAARSA